MKETASSEGQADRDEAAVRALYDNYDEASRLLGGLGQVEFVRTCEIVARYLPPPPAVVFDIGGGPGHYLRWLLAEGYEAHLLDPVPIHAARAQTVVAAHRGPNRGTAEQGNALALPFPDSSGDAVLLLGPLYHLTAKADRLAALAEARRVLRPGGLLAAAAIGRFSDLLYALDDRLLHDGQFTQIVARSLQDGRHHNPQRLYSSFTSGYFHHPEQLEAEVTAAGFTAVQILAVEGPAWADRDLAEDFQEPAFRERLLTFLREIEADRTLLGASPHLLAVAQAPLP